jgi:hypothetical protein
MIRLCGAAVMLAVAAPPAHRLPDRQPQPADLRKASPTFARAHREHHRARTHVRRGGHVGLDPVLILRGQESKRSMGTHREAPGTRAARREIPHPPLSSLLYAEWTRVAICEEGGWIGWSGPAFPDSLGITAANWWSHGGTSDVSPAAQIAVAERIQTWVPDQEGCAAW